MKVEGLKSNVSKLFSRIRGDRAKPRVPGVYGRKSQGKSKKSQVGSFKDSKI